MAGARNDGKFFALVCLALALATAALYWPITSHPFILLDDEQYVTANPHVTTGLNETNFVWAFTTGYAANWHPLTWLSHQLDCTLFGLNAGGHHLINLLYHVANTLLLFVFLRGATGALWRSAFVAALFAWHPLHVESVAWVSERKDVLSTFFFLLTLIAYAKHVARDKWRVTRAARPMPRVTCHLSPSYWLALLLFACGLMSKPMVVTLPFVLLLLDVWPFQRFNVSAIPRLLIEKIPFFVLTIAGSVVTLLVQSREGAVWQTPLSGRLANAAIAYTRYVAKMFWPDNLAIVYIHPNHWPIALTLGAVVFLAVCTFLCVRNWCATPFLAVGWFWFLGTLVPTIGIVQVGGQAMADRYTYIPSIGFFIALVWGAADFLTAHPRWKNILLLLTGGALVGCLVATSIQISYWRDNVSLFLHAIRVSPDNYIAENCLGKAFEKNGDKARALVMYRNAVKLAPRFPQSQFNYGVMLLHFGDVPEALKHLEAAAALVPRDPDVQFALGGCFAQHNSWTNALDCFSNCVAVRPEGAPAQYNYGCALANLGHFAAAESHFREALRLQPDYAAAQKALDRLLASHPKLH